MSPCECLSASRIFPGKTVMMADTVFVNQVPPPLHRHDFYEFFLIREGTILHWIDGGVERLVENTLVFIRPDDAHALASAGSTSPAVITNVAFVPEVAAWPDRIIPDGRDGKPTGPRSFHAPAHYAQLMDELRRLLPISAPAGTVFFQGLLRLVLAQLTDVARKQEPTPPLWLQQACEELRKPENYTVGLARFVALTGRSQEHFTREMRRCYAMTPTTYLANVRLAEAAKQLTRGGDRILDILYEVGFNNVAHFNTLFKKRFGVTPREYRARNQRVFGLLAAERPARHRRRKENEMQEGQT